MTAVPPARAPDLDARAALLLTTCCLIWGIGIVMAKIANLGISPVLNAGLRSVVSGLVIWGWAMARGTRLYERDGTLVAGVVCGSVFAAEFLVLYAGLALTSAARGTVFLHAAPFVAAIGEHLLVPGHRLTPVRMLGLLAAFVGLAVAFGEGLVGAAATSVTGDLLCLAGGILWGVTTIVIKATSLRRAPAEKILLYQLAVSAVALPLASLAMAEPGVTDMSPHVVAAFLYTALAVVSFGYLAWFWMMRTYSAASLHAFTFLTPIFGVIAGHLILGERLSVGLIAGLALVAGGIWLVNKPTKHA
ncbi:MAG: DMT family transporter [Hyphomicrobiaceae bacterium]|jgi:drug/metabolite transporter (DMT)-like permease